MHELNESKHLAGKVRRCSLPVYQVPTRGETAPLKRLLLPQGELAQLHNGAPPIHYLAFIELRAGTDRGNHYHKIKEEYVYLMQGTVQLLLEDVSSKTREILSLSPGDLVIVSPGIAHTLRVTASGQAVEFSEAPFDATDIYRYPL